MTDEELDEILIEYFKYVAHTANPLKLRKWLKNKKKLNKDDINLVFKYIM